MRLLKVLTDAWKSIISDFIVKLSLSKKVFTRITYDLILIIINRLIKYIYFIFYKEELTIEELIYTFNRNIIINYGILKEIISNKDKLFISNF
jgi:hypothetical protein